MGFCLEKTNFEISTAAIGITERTATIFHCCVFRLTVQNHLERAGDNTTNICKDILISKEAFKSRFGGIFALKTDSSLLTL